MSEIFEKKIEPTLFTPTTYNTKPSFEILENFEFKEAINDILNKQLVNNILDSSYLLNKRHVIGQVFENKFNDTLNFVFRNPTPLILEALDRMEKQVWSTIEHIYEEELKYFFPKWNDIKDYISIHKGKKIWLFDKDFYDFDVPDTKKLIKSLYFFTAIYYISYFIWLGRIKEAFSNYFKNKKLDPTNTPEFNKFSITLKEKLWNTDLTKYEENTLYNMGWLLKGYLDYEISSILLDHLAGARKKTLYSAMLKLLKSDKYLDQFDKEGILWDQLGFKVIFNEASKKKLVKVAQYFKEEEKKSTWIVNKFNDRGVLEINHDNKDTLTGIFPFVNVWFLDEQNNLPLGELSLRYFSKMEIYNLLLESKTAEEFIWKIIQKVDDLNHEIYKNSQQIKILRKLFVDQKILPRKRNLSISAKKFLKDKEKQAIEDIKTNLKKLLNQLGMDFILEKIDLDSILQKQYLTILKEKVYQVIKDLAWERTSPKIKETKSYLKLKDDEKKWWLRRLWKYFENSLDKERKEIFKYSKEIQYIYKHIYIKEYNHIMDTNIFYGEIVSKLEKINKKITSNYPITNEIKEKVINLKNKYNWWN